MWAECVLSQLCLSMKIVLVPLVNKPHQQFPLAHFVEKHIAVEFFKHNFSRTSESLFQSFVLVYAKKMVKHISENLGKLLNQTILLWQALVGFEVIVNAHCEVKAEFQIKETECLLIWPSLPKCPPLWNFTSPVRSTGFRLKTLQA